jgi:hypothetical protein
MTTSEQEEQAERRRVELQDADVRRQQGTTMHQFAEAEAAIPRGRFDEAVPRPYVIGSKAAVASAYPAASAAHQTELPPEPPTGYCIDDLDPSTSASVEASGEPMSDAAPSPLTPLGDEQRADVGSSFPKTEAE